MANAAICPVGEGECFMPFSSACACWGKASEEVVELADVAMNGMLSSYALPRRPGLKGIFTGEVDGEWSDLFDIAFRTLSFRRLVVPPSFLARERA